MELFATLLLAACAVAAARLEVRGARWLVLFAAPYVALWSGEYLWNWLVGSCFVVVFALLVQLRADWARSAALVWGLALGAWVPFTVLLASWVQRRRDPDQLLAGGALAMLLVVVVVGLMISWWLAPREQRWRLAAMLLAQGVVYSAVAAVLTWLVLA